MRRLALILHAHLPWVREREPWSDTERWFHEAMWECYLPLLAWLETRDVAMTISVSPPLAAMMRDPLLAARLRDQLDALSELNHEHAPTEMLRSYYADRLQAAKGGRLSWLERFAALRRVERMTTSATHAFLPGLEPVSGIRAQLAIGRAAWTDPGRCMWLPECAWVPKVDEALAILDVDATVVDEHAVALVRPAVTGSLVRSRHGVAYAARDRDACLHVWSRERGYPGHPCYREFHRDLGFDTPNVSPLRPGTMTGLKYHRITDRNMGSEELYDPALAAEQIERDASDFVERLSGRDEPAVVAFDAELFGHWWHEGLAFLDAVARLARAADIELVTLSTLVRDALPVAEPTRSTWGRGGYSADWIHPRATSSWRDVYRAHRDAVHGVSLHIDASGVRGRALDAAIDATLQAEASDWIYMITQRDHAPFARRRLVAHVAEAARMLDIAAGSEPSRAERITLERPRTVTGTIDSATLRRCFISR